MNKLTILLILILIPFISASDYGVNFEPLKSTDVNIYTGNLTQISQMEDVYTPSPTDGQILSWDSTTTKWIATTISEISKWTINITNKFFYTNGDTLSFNDTLLNNTIDTRAVTIETDPIWLSEKNNYYLDSNPDEYYNSDDFVISDYYTQPQIDGFSLSKWTDDLGDRGYTSVSNFTNDFNFYNSTTIPDYILSSNEETLSVNSSDYWDELDSPLDSWISTYNSTYDDKISFDTVSSDRLADTSGTNTGDNSINTLYSGLEASKEDIITYPTESADTKYYRGDKTFHEIVIGSGGFASNTYLSDTSSTDVATYKSISYDIDAGETEETITVDNTGTTNISYLYEEGIGVTTIPSGVWRAVFYGNIDSNVGDTYGIFTVFRRDTTGDETDLFSITSEEMEVQDDYTRFVVESTQDVFTVNSTDRIGVRASATSTSVADRTINYIIGDGRGAYFNTPLATRHDQLRDKNGEDAFQHITLTQKENLDNQSGVNTGDQDLSGYSTTTEANSLYAPINYGDDWNKTYADTLYYDISNPSNFYNSDDFSIIDYFTKTDILGFSFYNSSDFLINDYYLDSNPDGFISSYTETDPVWTADKTNYIPYIGSTENVNLSINNITANYFIGDGIDSYDGNGINVGDELRLEDKIYVDTIDSWDGSGITIQDDLLIDYINSSSGDGIEFYDIIWADYPIYGDGIDLEDGIVFTDYLESYNSDYITFKNDTLFNKNINITGYIYGESSLFNNNVTVEKLVFENDAGHYMEDNSTCIIIKGDSSILEIC